MTPSSEEDVDVQRLGAGKDRRRVGIGASLFMIMDHIFHNRRDVPALIADKPEPTAQRTHIFGLPEPLGEPAERPRRRRRQHQQTR